MTENKIIILDFKKTPQEYAEGVFTVRMNKISFEIHGVMLHEKNNSRWICLPQKEYKNTDGTKRYQSVCEFTDSRIFKQFQTSVPIALVAVSCYKFLVFFYSFFTI